MSSLLTKPVVVNCPGESVVFDGVDFTLDATLTITAATEVTIKNCRFFGLVPGKAKVYPIVLSAGAETKLVIEGCFFGNNPSTSKNKVYNLIELSGTLLDGSSISDNYFCAECCTHNIVNVYNVADEATVKINNNHAENSVNMVRIGTMGEPTCTIMLNGNTYEATTNDAWGGLLLIQPYGNKTTSFNGVTIQMNKTKNKTSCDQLYYCYAGSKEPQFEKETNWPKVYIDGKLQEDLIIAK